MSGIVRIPKMVKRGSGTLYVNQNGTHNVIDREFVEVDVPSEEPVLIDLVANENKTYNASEYNADGFGSVEVDVPTDSGEDEGPPLPDEITWARNFVNNDTQEGYPAKVLMLIDGDYYNEMTLMVINGEVGLIKTSDGVTYTIDEDNVTFDHVFNAANETENQCIPSTFSQYKKIRWVMFYLNSTTITGTLQGIAYTSHTIYKCYSGQLTVQNWYEWSDTLEGVDFINGAKISQVSTSTGSMYSYLPLKWLEVEFDYSRNLLQTFNKLERVILKVGSGNTGYLGYLSSTGNKENVKHFEILNLQKVTDLYYAFYKLPIKKFPNCDTTELTNLSSAFGYSKLENISSDELNTEKVTNMNSAFTNCHYLKSAELKTPLVTNIGSMFSYCYSLNSIELSDVSKVTSFSSAFYKCCSLRHIKMKNIKRSLEIGSTDYGQLICVDDLINIIKELWDNSSGTTIYKLTMGTFNINKLSNVYVRLITPSAEQVAEDSNIANKLPCEVCDATDEGAMLIDDYVIMKNWNLA